MNPARSFAVAVSFLTRIPAARVKPVQAHELPGAAPFYPVVGALVGAALAGASVVLARVPPVLLAVALCALSVLLTGAFHEDGLADSLDGLGGGATRARALEIMKDSRIGTFGAVGLNILLLARFGLYQSIPRAALPLALVASACASRFAALPLMAALTYARSNGIASPHAGRVTWLHVLGGAVLPVALAAYGGRSAQLALLASLLICAGLGLWVRSRVGGYTGDTLGLCICLSELGSLACFV